MHQEQLRNPSPWSHVSRQLQAISSPVKATTTRGQLASTARLCTRLASNPLGFFLAQLAILKVSIPRYLTTNYDTNVFNSCFRNHRKQSHFTSSLQGGTPKAGAQHGVFSQPSLSQGKHSGSPDHLSRYGFQDPSCSDPSNLHDLESSVPPSYKHGAQSRALTVAERWSDQGLLKLKPCV